MSTLDTLAHEVFATVDTHDLEAIAGNLADDCEFSAPGFAATGAQAVIGFMAPFLAAFPDIHHEVLSTVESGDKVALELEITGTHTAPLAGPGGELPATGKRVKFTAANVWQVADGKIVSYHVYFDTAT